MPTYCMMPGETLNTKGISELYLEDWGFIWGWSFLLGKLDSMYATCIIKRCQNIKLLLVEHLNKLESLCSAILLQCHKDHNQDCHLGFSYGDHCNGNIQEYEPGSVQAFETRRSTRHCTLCTGRLKTSHCFPWWVCQLQGGNESMSNV